jgi:hypothetical protein
VAQDIDENKKEIYDQSRLLLSFPTINARDILEKEAGFSGILCVNFITPTQLRAGGDIETPPGFRTLFSRLAFRINALSNYYANKLCISEKNLKHLAREASRVSIADAKIEIIPEFIRISHDRATTHGMFFKGTVCYSGNFSKGIMGILKLGTLLHVGKFAAFGCGKYTIMGKTV